MKGLFDLHGKVTVVTGGNGGIGLGYARGIAKQGGDVSIWARSTEKMLKAKAELETYGVKVTTQEVDISSEQQIINAYDTLMKEHGRLDCVIANAGLPPSRQNVLELTTQEYHDLLGVNMHGAFYTLREGARHMVKRAEAGEPGGSLIFCGSLSILLGIQRIANYTVAKGGIDALVRCMAIELAQYGIRANTVVPGFISTGMTGSDGETSPIDEFYAKKIPLGRPGYPSDFEGIAAFLCSDCSSFVTGTRIVIDGADSIKN